MRHYKEILYLVLIIIPLTLISCGGGGEDSGGQGGQNTTINGTIANIIASADNNSKSIRIGSIIEKMSFIREAKAQGGVTVTAIVDGSTVASDSTDPQGNFSLMFNLNSASNVLILFDINGDTVSLQITIEQGSVVNLIITINLNEPQGDEVDIVEMESVVEAIRCESGSLFIEKNANETFIIDGNGEDCIRTAGNCSVFIDPEDVVMTNCEKCIDARGTSDVTVISPDGNIVCEAFEDGIRTVGNAEVFVSAFGEISISAGENGISSVGNSLVTLEGDSCVIDSNEAQIDVDGNATVNIDGCGILSP